MGAIQSIYARLALWSVIVIFGVSATDSHTAATIYAGGALVCWVMTEAGIKVRSWSETLTHPGNARRLADWIEIAACVLAALTGLLAIIVAYVEMTS